MAQNSLLPPSPRAAQLQDLITHHNRLYWDEHTPQIPDVEYDALVRELTALWPQAPVLSSMGPSQAAKPAAAGASELERLGTEVVHAVPMLSLDKAYDDEELKRWTDKVRGALLVMPKVDGIACSVLYDAQGNFQLAATRGDGEKGDDISVNVRAGALVPMKIARGPCEVRGEIYMKRSVFQEKFAVEFSNPRNLTAGAIKLKDPERSKAFGLSLMAYGHRNLGVASESEGLSLLATMGFEVIPFDVVEIVDAPAAYVRLAAARQSFEFEADGVVFRTNLLSEQERLGATNHHPRYALAYKFQGESAPAKLVEVQWNVSRSGTITPIACIEPTPLSGVTVGRASLHHAGYIAKLGITQGATLLVMRRGDVIPHVEAVVAPGHSPIEIPATCPSCGSPTKLNGDFLACTQPLTCPDAVVGVLKHFVQTVDIQGVGPKLLKALLDRGLVKRPADLFALTKEQLLAVDRMGETSATKIMAAIALRRTLALPVFLASLGVDDLGTTVSASLAAHFGSLQALRAASEEELSSLHGVGTAIAHNVVEGLKQRAPDLDSLLQHVTLEGPKAPVESGHVFSGKSVVFTGTMDRMDRKEAQKRVVALGGKTPSSVTKDLHYLVTGTEKDGGESSKLKAARKLQAQGAALQVLDEAAFLALLG